MLGNKTFKAQSAMEYLMTYGWAILIIAVVLGALFSLGVFSGGNLLGTSCVASPGFLCSNPSLSQVSGGTLSFTFGQNLGTTIYNIMMACAATSSSGGLPNNPAAWNTINTAGSAVSNSQPNINSALSLVSGQTQTITGLPCWGTTGTLIGTGAAPAAIGTSFSGYVWINYTQGAIACTAPGCTWVTIKALTVTLKVV